MAKPKEARKVPMNPTFRQPNSCERGRTKMPVVLKRKFWVLKIQAVVVEETPERRR